MRVGLITREYPPEVYGGAGVHVEYLSRELARRIEVEVHCWGTQRLDAGNLHVRGDQPPPEVTAGCDAKFTDRRRCAGPEPVADEGAGQDRHRAYPHLVRGDGWLSGQKALWDSLCADNPLAGAAARVEGGAAWLRLRDELLDGAHGDPRRGRDHRRLAWDEDRHSARLPRGGRGPRACHLQRHRRGPVPQDLGDRSVGQVRCRSVRALRSVRRAGSRARRAWCIWWTR